MTLAGTAGFWSGIRAAPIAPRRRESTAATRRGWLAACFAAVVLVPPLAAQEPQRDKAARADGQELFNGVDLQGWEGDASLWFVEEGALTGRTTAEHPIPENNYLIWRGGTLKDFELTLQFRIVGGNSGVQFRSRLNAEGRIAGYQADIDAGHQYIGILYDERGRGIMVERGEDAEYDEQGKKSVRGKTCDVDQLLASLRKEDWNDYTIIAQGHEIRQILNGHTTVRVLDRDPAHFDAEGLLALQLHAGPPMTVQFRQLRLRALPAAEDSKED